MPACGLRRGSRGGRARPIFISTSSRPSREAKPRGVDDREPPQACPRQAGSRGGGVPHEVPMTQAMTTKGARRAPARTVSFFPLWCKGSKHRREHQAKSSISMQQDQDQQNGRMEVIVEPKPASPPEPLTDKPTLVKISVPHVPLQNGQLLAPSPLNIWEEAQGLCL